MIRCAACLLSLLSLLLYTCFVDSFSVRKSTRRLRISTLSSSRSNSSGSDDGRRNYYDILEASPTASQAQLRDNYLRLARQTHPDAGSQEPDTAPFSEIAEAWSILGDPKERLRYDRALKAKEFTDNMGELIELGIRNAIPFIGKTAKTTMNVIETSSQQLNRTAADLERSTNEMLLRMEKARNVSDLLSKSRILEQRALKEDKLAEELQRRLKQDRRDVNLHSSQWSLTAAQAQRISRGFQFLNETEKDFQTLPAMIDSLSEIETKLKDQTRDSLNAQRRNEQAQSKATSALNAQKRAQQRLEEAQRALEQAKKDVKECQQAQKEADQREKLSREELDSISSSLERLREKMRAALQEQEAVNLRKEEENIKKEIARLRKSSQTLRLESSAVEKQVQSIQQQQQKAQQQQQQHKQQEPLS